MFYSWLNGMSAINHVIHAIHNLWPISSTSDIALVYSFIKTPTKSRLICYFRSGQRSDQHYCYPLVLCSTPKTYLFYTMKTWIVQCMLTELISLSIRKDQEVCLTEREQIFYFSDILHTNHSFFFNRQWFKSVSHYLCLGQKHMNIFQRLKLKV